MKKTEPFTIGNTYHVYNCGINGCKIFKDNENYIYFMQLYSKYLTGIFFDTFAYVLMPNHFHFLLRVNEYPHKYEGFNPATPDRVPNPVRGFKTNPSQQISKLFNAYAQAFNKRYKRHGALFERPFKRKRITSDTNLRNVVIYIHNNPVHHGYCDHVKDYKWSSYRTFLSTSPSKLKREEVIRWFDDVENFKYMHSRKMETTHIEEWLEIGNH